MPVISFNYQEFTSLLGHTIPKKTLIEKLPMIGADLDDVQGDEISIEFFPNRPDLTSIEGIVRACRAFFDLQPGLTTYTITPSDITTTIDPSVKQVRPFVATAYLTNVVMTVSLIASLMDLQEKLHIGIGRNRKKLAIGVHDFAPITPPFTYKAVNPQAVSFVPLGKNNDMTLAEILRDHEKGVEYAHILKNNDTYPLIVDSNNQVLSFPPIINGILTEVNPNTSEIFIDVTGFDHHMIHYALTIITTALAERGAHIHATTVIDGTTKHRYPMLTPQKTTLSTKDTNTLLGTQLSDNDIISALQRMGYDATKQKQGVLSVSIPAWRADILHPVDLIEDVAIGFGYDKFTSSFPKDLTFGATQQQLPLIDTMRIIMIGLGFNEVTTFTISNKQQEFTNMGMDPQHAVEIQNPIGEEYSLLRMNLLPSLLSILKENRHHPLPQQLFEIGYVVNEKGKNQIHVSGVKIDAKASFTECKSIVEAISRDSGIKLHYTTSNHPGFIPGRQAQITQDKNTIGVYGELHPQTITSFSLEHPIIGFELDITSL